MSQKIRAFTDIITVPLNVHNFEVEIPGFSYPVVVQSSVFPSEKMRMVVLHTYGEEVRYPTIPQNNGEWPVRVPDDENGTIRDELDAYKTEMYDQKSGQLTPTDWIDHIVVKARALDNTVVFSTSLMQCWLIGREDVQLDNSDPTKPWMWDYKFKYNWIEDS